MKIPEKVKVLSKIYKVVVSDKVLALDNTVSYGLCDHNFPTISINNKLQDEQGMHETFIHELLHAIIKERNITVEDNEVVVTELAKGLINVMIDNKNIFGEE